MARVLIVDDEPSVVAAMQLYLQHKGHEVHTALNGQEALQKLTAERPQLILLDVRMPTMDGLQVLDHVRRLDRDVGSSWSPPCRTRPSGARRWRGALPTSSRSPLT
jgi:CheY-like chemotaxis protein